MDIEIKSIGHLRDGGKYRGTVFIDTNIGVFQKNTETNEIVKGQDYHNTEPIDEETKQEIVAQVFIYASRFFHIKRAVQ